MRVECFENPQDFWDLCYPLLSLDPVRNNLPLRVLGRMVKDIHYYSEFKLGVLWNNDEKPCSFFWHTPPHPLGVTFIPHEARDFFVDFLKKESFSYDAIVGPKDVVLDLSSRLSLNVKDNLEMWGYALGKLIMPPCTGDAFLASMDDKEELYDIHDKFVKECGMGLLTKEQNEKSVNSMIKDKTLFVLKNEGKIISTTNIVPLWNKHQTESLAYVVNFVYTYLSYRRQKKAAFLVASLCQKVREEKEYPIFLFADQKNPSSNKAYINIGFENVFDYLEIRMS